MVLTQLNGSQRKIMKRRTKVKIEMVEDTFAPDFKQESMIMQLRKVVDSIGNPNPLHWVRTDNGRNIWVAHKHARKIVELYDNLTSREAKSSYVDNRMNPTLNASLTRAKQQLTESMQTTAGLQELIKQIREYA